MTTVDYALLIAVLAFAVSAASLAWTIRRDTQRPKVKVRWQLQLVLEEGMSVEEAPRFLMLNLTNMGPAPVTVQMAQLGYSIWSQRKWRRWRGKVADAVLKDSQPGYVDLPITLTVGQTVNLAYPPDTELVTMDEFDRIGVFDTFGNDHWCTRRQFLRVRKEARARL